MNIHFDDRQDEPVRRARIFTGDLFVFSPSAATTRLVDFARELVCTAFAPLDPCQAQHHMPVEEFAAVLAELKPKFMHDPRAKEMVQDILREAGCDLGRTYFDIPRMRTMTHGDYLRSGIALAVPPHRDTWYGGTESQLNWWLPVMGVRPENTMVFHPEFFARPIENTSDGYDHDAWRNKSRREAAKHIKTDTREYPRADAEVDPAADLRVACPEGGVLVFSASQLHSTSPNNSGMTRFSVDFRTVDIDDVIARRGAPNVDNFASGSTLDEYLSADDLTPLPRDVAEAYDRAAPAATR